MKKLLMANPTPLFNLIETALMPKMTAPMVMPIKPIQSPNFSIVGYTSLACAPRLAILKVDASTLI
jgi:hypothetical protein